MKLYAELDRDLEPGQRGGTRETPPRTPGRRLTLGLSEFPEVTIEALIESTARILAELGWSTLIEQIPSRKATRFPSLLSPFIPSGSVGGGRVATPGGRC